MRGNYCCSSIWEWLLCHFQTIWSSSFHTEKDILEVQYFQFSVFTDVSPSKFNPRSDYVILKVLHLWTNHNHFGTMSSVQMRPNWRSLTIIHHIWWKPNKAYRHKDLILTIKHGCGGVMIWVCFAATGPGLCSHWVHHELLCKYSRSQMWGHLSDS